MNEYKGMFNASQHMVKHSSYAWQFDILYLNSQISPCGHGEHDKNNTCKQLSTTTVYSQQFIHKIW